MITEIDLSQYYVRKNEIKDEFNVSREENIEAAKIIGDAIKAKPDLGTSHNNAARGDHTHDGVYLKSYTPPTASVANAGIVQLSESTNSSSKNQAATPSAVKAAYDLAQNKTVTVTKLGTATENYLATYEIKQGNDSLGKIDIPKDFLIESGTVKTSQSDNDPKQGYFEGDKYIDLVINAKEGAESKSHIFINLKDLFTVYEADESSLKLSVTSGKNVFSIKEEGVQSSHLANNIIENKHISSSTKIDFSKLNISKNDITSLNLPFSATEHGHGSIAFNGQIRDDIQSVDRIVVTDTNKNIKTATKIPSSLLTLPDATTNGKGIIQLSDSISNSSTTLAATANAVNQLNNKFSGAGTDKNAHTHTKSQITDLKQVTLQAINTQTEPASEQYNRNIVTLNQDNPIAHYPNDTLKIQAKITNGANNAISGETVTFSCDKGYFVSDNTLLKTVSGSTNSGGLANTWWIPSEWGLCSIYANNEKIQILVGGYKTYVDSRFKIYYNEDIVIFELNWQLTTNLHNNQEWVDLTSISIPAELRPPTRVTTALNFHDVYLTIDPSGLVEYYNSQSKEVVKPKLTATMQWRKK